MNRSPLSSIPPSQPSPYRYLGRGGGERPVRLQIIIALVAGLILVAVPLYLWRRPRAESIPSADAAVASAPVAPVLAPPPVMAPLDAGPPSISLAPFTSMKCENPGPGKTDPARCDHVTFFEDALAKAIKENQACAPASKTPYTVSFVMDMSFRTKKLNLYTGSSSSLKKDKRKELLKCVKKALPTPDWATIPHQYVRYKVDVVATYPPSDSF